MQACVHGRRNNGPQGGPGQKQLLVQGMGEGGGTSPTLHQSLTDPALGANSYLKVMVPKSTNVTFQTQPLKWA
jgi:hypothetical protein